MMVDITHTIDESVCFVCLKPVTEVRKAGYITTAKVGDSAMGMVAHMACLEALNDEIVQHRNKADTVKRTTNEIILKALLFDKLRESE